MKGLSITSTSPAPLNLEIPVRVLDVHLAYGKQAVLKGVDWEISRGEVVGLIGRNGAGKSSLFHALLGLVKPQRGRAELFGIPALELNEQCKQRLGFVAQESKAFGWMTVNNLLDFAGGLYDNWDSQYADRLVKRWDLPRQQKINLLSPGQAQRLALVRAMAPRPALLVLDEPASALDPVARRDLLREIITHTCDDGTTVLFSTHIVSDLERIASRVAFLDEGRLLLDDQLEDIKERVFRVIVPSALAGTLRDVFPGELKRRIGADGDLSLLLLSSVHQLPESLRRPDVQVDQLCLEDVFIEVVG